MTASSPKKPVILIVDDLQQNIQVLGMILNEFYRVNVALNGKDALKLTEKIVPDLILLDIMMPEMDGFEICRRLKQSEKTKDIPIIFLTALTEKSDVVKGFELGAVDYIVKPFNAPELLMRVRTHLDLKFSKEQIERVSNERKELLHILCHDLSSPFSAIISMLRIADDEKNDDVFRLMKDGLKTMAQNGLDVIDLVRKMRALEEHMLELQPINLIEAFGVSSYMLKDRLSYKNIKLELNVDKKLYVRAEKTSFINSVLNNILTNAIKFSHRGSAIIVNSETQGDDIILSIRDFGIGMSERLQKDLFDISKTTHRPGTEDEPGTGFGMPLVKKFVLAYGGDIEVLSKEQKTSPQDHGTEIRLKLKQFCISDLL